MERGLLVWQGDSDGFHRDLYFGAAPVGQLPAKTQVQAVWSALWRNPGAGPAQFDLTVAKSFDSSRWDTQLDRLFVQQVRNRPGADLDLLGVKKKVKR